MFAADPTTVGTTPAVITAFGGAIAAVLGAMALFGRRKPSDDAVTATKHPAVFDPEDQPARLRERLAALEAQVDNVVNRVDNHDEQIALLRALEVTTEGMHRAAPRKHTPRKRT